MPASAQPETIPLFYTAYPDQMEIPLSGYKTGPALHYEATVKDEAGFVDFKGLEKFSNIYFNGEKYNPKDHLDEYIIFLKLMETRDDDWFHMFTQTAITVTGVPIISLQYWRCFAIGYTAF